MRKFLIMGVCLFTVLARADQDTNAPIHLLITPEPGLRPINIVIAPPKPTTDTNPVITTAPTATPTTPSITTSPAVIPVAPKVELPKPTIAITTNATQTVSNNTNTPSSTNQISLPPDDGLQAILAKSSSEHVKSEASIPADLRIPSTEEDTNVVVYSTLPALAHLEPTGEYVSRYVSIPTGTNQPPRLIRFDLPIFRDRN